jgi:hypothetical protein
MSLPYLMGVYKLLMSCNYMEKNLQLVIDTAGINQLLNILAKNIIIKSILSSFLTRSSKSSQPFLYLFVAQTLL